MRRAAKVDANHDAVVCALRAAGASVQSLAGIGKGCPDLLVWHAACGHALIEVKDGSKPPSHRKHTSDQVSWIAAWGGPVWTVTDADSALRAIGVLS